jgi:hypothetical protein
MAFDLFSVRVVTRRPLLFLYEWVVGLGTIFFLEGHARHYRVVESLSSSCERKV